MSEVFWNRLPASVLRALADQGAVVLVPVASTEQHGPHLPTGVDDLLATDVCRRTAEVLVAQGSPAVVTPSVWCGMADHHVDFGGTFALRFSTFHALLRDICHSVQQAGFTRILLVNGHGGNVAALNVLVGELARDLTVSVAATSYFLTADEQTARILEDQDTFMHGCEGETSLMMAVAPDLVDSGRLADAYGPPIVLLSDPKRVFQEPVSFREITSSGVAGDARRAGPGKGEALLTVYVKALATFLAGWAPETPRPPAR